MVSKVIPSIKETCFPFILLLKKFPIKAPKNIVTVNIARILQSTFPKDICVIPPTKALITIMNREVPDASSGGRPNAKIIKGVCIHPPLIPSKPDSKPKKTPLRKIRDTLIS